jgi:hypothetical protein
MSAGWLDDALLELERGNRVFPIAAKKPLVKWGREASADPAQVRRWAVQFPQASGYGIALRRDQYVFDADTSAAVAWCRSKLPATRETSTGRDAGGVHFEFHVPNGRRLRMLNTRLGELWGVPGLDGKTLGGYVAGAGSLHKSGTRYRILDGRRPAALPVPVMRKIGDRPTVVGDVGNDGLTERELASSAHAAAWGKALRAEAVGSAAQTLRNLRRYLRVCDEGWADAFLEAGVQLGIYVAPGAISYEEAVAALEHVFEHEDTWGCVGNVPRSIRRGIAFGYRQEVDGWL